MKYLLSLILCSMFMLSLVSASLYTTSTQVSTGSLTSGAGSQNNGLKLVVNETFKLTKVQTKGASLSYIKIMDINGVILTSANLSGDFANFDYIMQAGKTYRIEAVPSGSVAKSYDVIVFPIIYNTFTLLNASQDGVDLSNNLASIVNLTYELESGDGNNTLYKCFQNNTNKFLEINFKNETSSKQATSSQATINIDYSYNGASYVNYNYPSPYETPKYYFCSGLGNNITVNTTISYVSTAFENFPSRSYYENFSINSTLTNKTLWTLPISLGSYTSFQVVDGSFIPIQGAFVSINRSGYGIISNGFTDGSGLITFFLEPTKSYNIYATSGAYSPFSTTLTPAQSSYTVNLGTGTLSSTTTVNNYNRGIRYTILPQTPYLINNTVYVFNATLTSSTYALDEFGISLLNNSNQVIANSSSSNSSGGYVGISANTGSNKLVHVNLYWKINGTYLNVTKTYYVSDTDGTGYSIKNFKNRFIGYMSNESDDDGLFGLKKTDNLNFNLNIIVFLIIFLFSGVFSYRYGLNSPASIMLFVTVSVWFFEVTTELIDVLPNSEVPFLTIVTSLIFLVMFVREVQ